MERYAEQPRRFTIQVGLTEWEFDPKATMEMVHQRAAQVIGTHYKKAYEQVHRCAVPTTRSERPQFSRGARWYRALSWVAKRWKRFRESEFWTVLSTSHLVTRSFDYVEMPAGTFSAIAWIDFSYRMQSHGRKIKSFQVSNEMACRIRDELVHSEPAWCFADVFGGAPNGNQDVFARIADMDIIINPFLKGESILPVFEV